MAKWNVFVEMVRKTNHEDAKYTVKEWEDAMEGTDASEEQPF
jgi:hypothetical protein